MKQFLPKLGTSMKQAFKAWNQRVPFASSAIIAYYTIFSLPGLLVIIINLAGYFFGKEAVTHQITGEIEGITGPETARFIQRIVANSSQTGGGVLASVLGIATLLFGATGVFYHLQLIFNKIWGVKPKKKQQFLKLLKDRLFSFGLILVVGFLLLISLILSAALSALSTWVANHLSESFLILFNVLDVLFSMGIITVLFAAMFKILPDAEIRWKDVWLGALLTTILFVVAKFALGLYFGNSDPASAYGAAGSVVVTMLWVSYAGLILLYGAEFTRVFARVSGNKIQPTELAEKAGDQTGSLVDKNN